APLPGVLDAVTAAFAAAPPALVHNFDGRDGVNLHAVLDETNIPLAPFPNDFTDFDLVRAQHFGTVAERADPNWANIQRARSLVSRYCIFADSHGNDDSSGQANASPGNEFMVTLGLWNTPGGTMEEQEGTFMHELGHTLGLSHGGGDGINNKP